MDVLRVVVMGVAGAGKSTVGSALAERLAARFVDADELHPPENVAKMAAGVPLTDADRQPWLDRLRNELAGSDRTVVTCSALRRAYRDVLRRAGEVTFVHLAVDAATASGRLRDRSGHFMKADMVASQFDALEPPGADEPDVVVIDADDDLERTVAAAIAGCVRLAAQRSPGRSQ